MISYFFWGMVILISLTALFYVVFVSLIYYWHEKNTTTVIVPLLYTFEFFTIGFLIISLISILLQYLPDILR